MKKILYIASIILLGAVSCTREAEMFVPSPQKEGMVAVTMSVRLPVEISADTRATEKNKRDEQPLIESIRVAVFGTSGYPQAYELAQPVTRIEEGGIVRYEPTDKYATTNGDIYYFKVLLPVYEGEAHVHIIANGPATIPFADQKEETIMPYLTTSDDVGGYWASVILEDGILADLSDDGIMVTDEDGNYVPSSETASLFKDLVLVRNFAEISLLVEENAGISDVSWTLVNVPVSGSFAPMKGNEYIYDFSDYIYDTKTGKMVLCDLEKNPDGSLKKDDNGQPIPIRDSDGNIANLYETYDGYMVSTALNSTVPDESQIKTSVDSPLYVYERKDPNKTNPTYIMMKCHYGSDSGDNWSYYRVDLMDEALGGYFPLYRNYKYQFRIGRVGSRGSSTPAEAALRNSAGNMSLSAETQTLTDVSDGTSRLYVEFVEKTFITGGQKSFWVYYVPDLTDTYTDTDGTVKARINNQSISVSVEQLGTALANATITKDESRSTDDGMYFYNFTLNDQSAVDLTSVIRIKASNGKEGDDKSTLYRDLTLKVMKKMDMNLSLKDQKVDAGIGETTVLHIALDDTLQMSMFPLEFYIEDTNRTLNPTGKDGTGKSIAVPVKIGTSLFDPTNKNSYAFIRTVNWDEYKPMRDAWIRAKETEQEVSGIIDFTTEFKTIEANSQTEVYVDNEYFNMDSVVLFNDDIYVSPSTSTVGYNVQSIDIEILAATETTSWTAEGDSDAVSLSKTGGSGKAIITMSFPENQSFGSDNRYTATISCNGKDYPVEVIQKARTFNVTASATTVTSDVTEVDVNIVADEGLEWVATVDNGAVLDVTRASGEPTISSSGSHTLKVSFDPNTSGESITYTVNVVPDGNESLAESVEIQQLPAPKSFILETDEFENVTTTPGSPDFNSSDGGVTVKFTNAARQGTNDGYSIKLGYRSGRTNYDGTITVTPHNRVIKEIKVTYYNAANAAYDSESSSSPAGYSISSGVGVWSGETSSAVTINNKHSHQGNNYYFPTISSIEVVYY